MQISEAVGEESASNDIRDTLAGNKNVHVQLQDTFMYKTILQTCLP